VSGFNKYAPPNWLGSQNPFSLPMPPWWWLKRLWDRDRELRILPGLSEACYRVARRSERMRDVRPALGNDSETGRMCRERCVPVVAIRPGITWNSDFFQWLDDHDGWRYRDPAKRLDEIDAEVAARQQAEQEDAIDQVSASAYLAMKLRGGEAAFVRKHPSWTVDGPTDGVTTHGPLNTVDHHREAEVSGGLAPVAEGAVRAETALFVPERLQA
jgi:hypothetical protein